MGCEVVQIVSEGSVDILFVFSVKVDTFTNKTNLEISSYFRFLLFIFSVTCVNKNRIY
jgi:hypothetical protein